MPTSIAAARAAEVFSTRGVGGFLKGEERK
jgi:hypothetical protein